MPDRLSLTVRVPHFAIRLAVVLTLLSARASGQDQIPDAPTPQAVAKSDAINVNWLYGAYLPKDVELKPLTNRQRVQLYLRQTYSTWGIYAKTAAFAVGNQATNSPPEWGGGLGGYGERLASRYGQFATQNTLSATGNFLLGYEPRYERCRCSGGWRRTGHALLRNFVTYNRTESGRRPQIAMYAGAMGAGMISSAWNPEQKDTLRLGYQSVLTQAAFGSFSNVVAEFAPDIGRLFKGKKKPQGILQN
jgi:hypothetical protein